ncbi:MAG: GNAT family N-acetyltransferase [Bdellovibrionales bacterium]|nr:GNAT family N-acetyltransferase [Bdellovibrionales bacterium]
MKIEYKTELSQPEKDIINAGFAKHTGAAGAPPYNKETLNWLAYDSDTLVGAVTTDILWDWIYVDELWVCDELRSQGLGTKLMQEVEQYALSKSLSGIWLWTQDWQAAEFYEKLGYEKFTEFDDFPKGFKRIGYRRAF